MAKLSSPKRVRLSKYDEGTLEGFKTCLSMVHHHICELRAEYFTGSYQPDRLYNRIVEDTK